MDYEMMAIGSATAFTISAALGYGEQKYIEEDLGKSGQLASTVLSSSAGVANAGNALESSTYNELIEDTTGTIGASIAAAIPGYYLGRNLAATGNNNTSEIEELEPEDEDAEDLLE